jgi:hypothetical protein
VIFAQQCLGVAGEVGGMMRMDAGGRKQESGMGEGKRVRVVHAAFVRSGHDDACHAMLHARSSTASTSCWNELWVRLAPMSTSCEARCASSLLPFRAAHYANIARGRRNFAAQNSPLVNRASVKLAAYFSSLKGYHDVFIAVIWRGSALAAIAFACATSAFAPKATRPGLFRPAQVMAARQSAVAAARRCNRGCRRQRCHAGAANDQAGDFREPVSGVPAELSRRWLPFRAFPQSTAIRPRSSRR